MHSRQRRSRSNGFRSRFPIHLHVERSRCPNHTNRYRFATITDAAGCVITHNIAIPDDGDLELTGFDVESVSCFGDEDGTGTALVAGGTQPLTFLWNDNNLQTTQTATGLPPGDYSVSVSDPNGCLDFDLVTIPEPLELSLSIATTPDSGSGNGTATITVFGGTPGFTFTWDDPAAQTAATATGLAFGTYNVTVTDTNGCSTSEEITIEEASAIQHRMLQYVQVWPVPAHNTLWLNPGTEQLHWKLLDATGRQVLEGTCARLTHINLEALQQGVYFLRIATQTGEARTIPIIKSQL